MYSIFRGNPQSTISFIENVILNTSTVQNGQQTILRLMLIYEIDNRTKNVSCLMVIGAYEIFTIRMNKPGGDITEFSREIAVVLCDAKTVNSDSSCAYILYEVSDFSIRLWTLLYRSYDF